MILDIPFELTQTEAEILDQLFYANRSITKKINLLSTAQHLSLNQSSYLVCLIIEDLVATENYKGLNKLYNSIDTTSLSINLAIPLVQAFKKIEHNITDTGNISHVFTNYLNEHNLAFEKI